MDAKHQTNWDLNLYWVADSEAELKICRPDKLTQRIMGTTDSKKYLSLNGKVIYPQDKNAGFWLEELSHESVLTNSDRSLNLERFSEGETVPISIVYPIKEFPGKDIKDEVNPFDFLTGHKRYLDLPKNEYENIINTSLDNFRKKLDAFDIELTNLKTYLRFGLY